MRRTASLGLLVALTLLLTSCAPFDDVLWRQVHAFKDPLTNALTHIEDTTPSAYADAIRTNSAPFPSHYWDGAADPADFGLDRGTLVVWDVSSTSTHIRLSAMISSGERDPEADPLYRDQGPYFGARAIYTCMIATADVPSTLYGDNYSSEKLDCPAALTATVGAGAVEVPISEFYG